MSGSVGTSLGGDVYREVAESDEGPIFAIDHKTAVAIARSKERTARRQAFVEWWRSGDSPAVIAIVTLLFFGTLTLAASLMWFNKRLYGACTETAEVISSHTPGRSCGEGGKAVVESLSEGRAIVRCECPR